MNKLPFIQGDYIVSIICEGPEEYDYLKRLEDLKVWNPIYRIDLINADGNGNIPARYQDKYQTGSSDVVLVFCDTDRKPYEQYKDIKRKIDYFHGKDGISDKVVIFGNPCTMQIVILHWGDVLLKAASKRKNAPIIASYTGIKGYDAHKTQREELMSFITAENYRKMVERALELSANDDTINSSNFGILMKNLEGNNVDWISEINNMFE